MQTIGEESDKDMRFDAMLQLVVDRPQLQVVLEGFERRLDLDQLDVEPPQLGRVYSRTDWCAAGSGLPAGALAATCGG